MIERLEKGSPAPLERVGGKAAGLVRLLDAGLTVPEAWVIPAGRRPTKRELSQWWSEVGKGDAWAVRSSAVAEDLDDASFAGVYETVLGNETAAKLWEAVGHCYAAYDSARAQTYRAKAGADAEGGIALVLQRMVAPRAAGVMLTANPQRPFAAEIVIDATDGLGDAVVSGAVDPDHFVLDRASGELRAERGERCLSDSDLAALHAVAAKLGPGRDLEFAFDGDTLHMLQDRPVTGLPPADPSNVWTRRMADEYLSEYALPLPSDLMGPWMGIAQYIELMLLQGRTDLVGIVPLRNHQGYSYLSGEYIAKVASAFPRSMRLGSFGDWFTPLWNARIEAERWVPQHLVGMFLAPFRDKGRGTINANVAALEEHCRKIDRDVVPKLDQDYSALDLGEWRRQMDEIEDFGLDHFRVIRWGMGPYATMFHKILEGLLRNEASDADGELYHALISGLPGTHTAALNREVWSLGMTAREDGELVALLRDGASLDAARGATADSAFWPAFDAFMAKHGHRSASRNIAKPRWREEPGLVLGLVRAQLQSDAPPEDPRVTEKRAADRRAAALRTANERLGTGPLGRLRRAILGYASDKAETFTVYRENQRYHLDYLLTHLRELVLAQGRHLVERGLLDETQDVFFLTGVEFYDAVAGRSTDRAADPAELEQRKQHFLTWRDRLPASFLFDEVETEGEIVEGDAAQDAREDGLTGVGASRGLARGPVRVVPDLARLSDVEPGDILVVNNIDPGWTPIFPLLAGLVTETGGILSHGAILAREYGIPTVTGVTDATTRLETGAFVEVDGNRGVVAVAEREEAAVVAA
jgi:phosphohistidine swiveling domain-containing protein